MKTTIHKLRVGDLVWAQVVENISSDEFIVSFQGDLIRVRNESLNQLKINEKILARVVAVSPLSFQIVKKEEQNRKATRINISV